MVMSMNLTQLNTLRLITKVTSTQFWKRSKQWKAMQKMQRAGTISMDPYTGLGKGRNGKLIIFIFLSLLK